MPYLNKAMLIGNIGKDPEIKTTQGGRKRATFSLATFRKYRDANGETREQTDWHNVVAWGKTADIIEQLGFRKRSQGAGGTRPGRRLRRFRRPAVLEIFEGSSRNGGGA